MSGLFQRFRKQPAASGPEPEPAPADTSPLLGHEAAHAIQGQATTPPSDDQDGFVEKINGPDFDAEANDVAMESLALSHEGVEVGESSESSTKLAQYAINGNSPGGTSPLEDMVDSSDEGSDEDGMAIEKLELAYEKVERTAGGATPDPPPQDLTQNEDTEAAGWPVKWYVPELDSDQVDPDEMTTLVRLTESKEMTGVISYIAPDQTTELFDADDEDSDPDDLA